MQSLKSLHFLFEKSEKNQNSYLSILKTYFKKVFSQIKSSIKESFNISKFNSSKVLTLKILDLIATSVYTDYIHSFESLVLSL